MRRRIEHRGGGLGYEVTGRGPRVLWIQGVGVEGRGWSPQTESLGGEFTCLTFDHRGMGASRPAPLPIRVEQMADDARALMDAERWESAHVVGHSLGGPAAIELALSARERVRSLTLLCTFSGAHTAAPATPRMLWLGARSRLGTRGMRRRGFLALVAAPGSIGPGETDAWCDRLGSLFGHDLADQPPIVAQQLKALRAYDAGSRLGELAGLPALVVSARHDPIAPPRAGRALAAAIPGARYVEIEDASHGLPITHADRINGLLREHLLAIEAGTGLRRDARATPIAE